MEDASVIAAEQLCRLIGCEFGAQRGGKLRQVGVARQRTGADQAKPIGAEPDMIEADQLSHPCEALGIGHDVEEIARYRPDADDAAG